MRARWRVVLAAVLAAAALAWFLFAPPDPEKILAGLPTYTCVYAHSGRPGHLALKND